MFYIYHIPNVKIGCSTQPTERVLRQGYTDYEVLEVYDCIDTASIREQELQKEYGYKVDKIPYHISKQRILKVTQKQRSKGGKKSGLNNVKKGHIQTLSKRYPPNMSNTWVKILQYDKKGNFIKEHQSITEAAKSVNRNAANIVAVCKGREKSSAGFIWKYKD